ncbi:xanthine dehydrogenase family protein molybdopterin-binding subunit [Roseateles koreensis]|uniref:Xanthine dehydrogenase family protein molybdopterin-binding subunit n=1 Tax=Roseateles koreensis TaxID=2987526 RepID=A0ABT5KQR5_9BURK|nr:xanthine dehydrogenase family protein molybdopterin-binding subunit [Roseateles koreensis]MDC8785252.1 xanthine dehydrogenase family protein molybdopterin-binding subunit [Roseateles koreensis]
MAQDSFTDKPTSSAPFPAFVNEAHSVAWMDEGLLRTEDARLLRGEGGFVANRVAPGTVHAVFVRSPHAHARITEIQADDARCSPGVLTVLTPVDFAGLRQPPVNPLLPGMQSPSADLLPQDRVLAVGAPVVLVVAETLQQAQTAADLVWVDYQDLPHATDFDATATALYASMPSNLAIDARVQVGQVPAGAPSAQASVELPRVAASPLEPRAALMQWHGETQTLQACLSTQTPSRAREDLAAALALQPAQVRVIATDVGGAFGAKASVFAEDLMLAAAACRAELNGRPVRWLATRGEDLLAGTHGRASRLQGRLWLDTQGRFTGLDAHLQFALGHWLPFSAAAPIRNASRILPGPYAVEALQVHAQAHLSHAAAVGIYRGAGRPEACILMERLVDAAARAQGLDPLDLRLLNAWRAQDLPRALPSGEWLDRCDLPALLERAAVLFNYRERRQQQAQERQQQTEPHASPAPLRGLGMALYVEPCGQGGESARLTALPDGRFLLATGSSAQGQGRETAYALIAAQALGCLPVDVTVVHGDTAHCPPGVGALASRSTAIGGSAILAAAEQLHAQLAGGAALPCSVELFHHVSHEAWASGCLMVEMLIDRDTGQPRITELVWVDDAGVLVHPDLVHGQLVGGLAQGLGQALMERIVYDDNGQLITGSLMDYALPRAEDMPQLTLESLATRSAANALGAKGVGEAGCIGLPAALLNAAHDALAQLTPPGQPPRESAASLAFPLTAPQLWHAMQAPA